MMAACRFGRLVRSPWAVVVRRLQGPLRGPRAAVPLPPSGRQDALVLRAGWHHALGGGCGA